MVEIIKVPIWIEVLKWIFLLFAVFGAYEGSKRDCNKLKMNILYTVTNVFSVIYFLTLVDVDWAYLCLYMVFLVISVTGIIRNGEYN